MSAREETLTEDIMGKHVEHPQVAKGSPTLETTQQSNLKEKSLKVSRSVRGRHPLTQEKTRGKHYSYSLDLPSHLTEIKKVIGKLFRRPL